MDPTLPFELAPRADGTWRSYWRDERLFVVVGGTAEAPSVPLLATLRGLVARWAETRQAIAAYTRALAPGHHVPLDPPRLGGFAASSCGFGGELVFQSLAVTRAEAPERAAVTFYTGEPDGYATYRVVLERGSPIGVSAFAS